MSNISSGDIIVAALSFLFVCVLALAWNWSARRHETAREAAWDRVEARVLSLETRRESSPTDSGGGRSWVVNTYEYVDRHGVTHQASQKARHTSMAVSGHPRITVLVDPADPTRSAISYDR